MGKKKARVKNYSIGKGDYKGYWGCEELRDMLLDIHRGNKKWGTDWYRAVENGFYVSAKKILNLVAFGEDKEKAIDMINRIIDIHAEERGEK
jgi:hypothetical protein